MTKFRETGIPIFVLFFILLFISFGYYFAYGVGSTDDSKSSTSQTTISSAQLKVPILVYHSVRPIYDGMSDEVKQFTVTPESFESQLQYLRDSGYFAVSFDDLVDAMEGKRILPANSVVITLDDGWQNQYIYAFPLLRKYNMPATFFIFTNAIGHTNYLTWNQVRELSASNMTIGSHSKSHPHLNLITDENKLRDEIAGSKSIIERHIGKRIDIFAYPFGGSTDSTASFVKKSGYKVGRRFSGGTYTLGDDPFTIKGIYVTDDFDDFKRLLAD